MNEAMIMRLKALAGKKCWSDDEDFMVDDYAGGNIDDAYAGGVRDCEVSLAREITAELEQGQCDPTKPS